MRRGLCFNSKTTFWLKQIPCWPQFNILSLQVACTDLGRRVTRSPSDSLASPTSHHIASHRIAGVGGHHTATTTHNAGHECTLAEGRTWTHSSFLWQADLPNLFILFFSKKSHWKSCHLQSHTEVSFQRILHDSLLRRHAESFKETLNSLQRYFYKRCHIGSARPTSNFVLLKKKNCTGARLSLSPWSPCFGQMTNLH